MCSGRCVWGSRRSPPQARQLPCLGSDVLDLELIAVANEQWRSCCPPKGLGGLIQAHLYAPDSPSRTTMVLAREPQKPRRHGDLPPSRALARYRGARTSDSEARGGRVVHPNLTPDAQPKRPLKIRELERIDGRRFAPYFKRSAKMGGRKCVVQARGFCQICKSIQSLHNGRRIFGGPAERAARGGGGLAKHNPTAVPITSLAPAEVDVRARVGKNHWRMFEHELPRSEER